MIAIADLYRWTSKQRNFKYCTNLIMQSNVILFKNDKGIVVLTFH
jgi:hypothetical protein